jgi:hypothetical protein
MTHEDCYKSERRKQMKKILISSLLLFTFCIPGLSQFKFTKLFTPPTYESLIPFHINNLGKIVAIIDRIDPNFPVPTNQKAIFAGVNGFANINIPPNTSTTSLYPAGLSASGDLWGGAVRRVGPNTTISESFIKCRTNPIQYFRIPNAANTVITGINDKHEVVGYYVDSKATPISPGPGLPPVLVFRSHGFKTVTPTSGLLPPIQYFDVSTETFPSGISNNGDIVGLSRFLPPDPSSADFDGVGFLISKGQVSTVEAPPGVGGVPPFGSVLSPSGINIHGVIVGTAINYDGDLDARSYSGFIWENGVVTFFDPPDGTVTFLSDINDSGVIVGSYNPLGLNEFAGPPFGFILTKQ